MSAKLPAIPSDAAPLGLLLANLPAALVNQAMQLAIARMDLTPEKLATILVRALNPDEIIGETEEAKLRGVSPTTLRGYKSDGILPKVVNG